ncbi:hypothetical protein ACFSR7_01965 [Cohnella sp. GCM10020058]
MNSCILIAQPFNKAWINCIYSNIMGILTAFNPSYEKMIYSIGTTYELLKINEKVIYPEMPSDKEDWLFDEGWFRLETKTDKLDLSNLIKTTNFSFDKNINFHHEIQKLINDGYYIFIDLDRIHFPGVEYERKNFVHPTFIYGFDIKRREYYLIEDCKNHRVYEYYSINFDQIEKAFLESFSHQTPRRCFGIQVIQEAIEKKLEITIKIDQIINNIESLLTTTYKIQDSGFTKMGMHKQCGIQCILDFSNDAEHMFSRIDNIELNNHYGWAMFPMDFQLRNISLLQHIYETSALNSSAFSSLHSQLFNLKKLWEIYKNNIFRYIEYRKLNKFVRLNVNELLRNIYYNEVNFNEYFLSTLKSIK